MRLQSYLLGIGASSIICWIAFILTILYISPETSRVLALSCFFVSFFFALAGTFTIIGFYIRTWASHNELYYANINISFRQGIFVAFAFVGILALQALNLLTWWDGILFVAIIILIEFYFLTKK
ncbi:hypothetical protein E3J85_01205 [Patescibacteria group bacterium]|nr:MAG: hypothetical protein E3J85_01205 [Patescibacteria group bacterium]